MLAVARARGRGRAHAERIDAIAVAPAGRADAGARSGRGARQAARARGQPIDGKCLALIPALQNAARFRERFAFLATNKGKSVSPVNDYPPAARKLMLCLSACKAEEKETRTTGPGGHQSKQHRLLTQDHDARRDRIVYNRLVVIRRPLSVVLQEQIIAWFAVGSFVPFCACGWISIKSFVMKGNLKEVGIKCLLGKSYAD